MARRKRNKRSAPKRSAPKRSAPKRSAPKRSAPKKSAPKKAAPKKAAPKKSAPKKAAPKRENKQTKKLQIQKRKEDRQDKRRKEDRQDKRRKVDDKKSKRSERRPESESKKSNKSNKSKKKKDIFDIFDGGTKADQLIYQTDKDEGRSKEDQEKIEEQQGEIKELGKDLKNLEKANSELKSISEASSDENLAYEVPTRDSLKFEDGLDFIRTNAAKIYDDRKKQDMPGRSGDYEVDNLKTVKDKISQMGGAKMYDKNNRFMGGQVGKNETLRINKQNELKATNLSEDPYGQEAGKRMAKQFKQRSPELRTQQRKLSRILGKKSKQKQPLGKTKSIQRGAKKFVNRLGKK